MLESITFEYMTETYYQCSFKEKATRSIRVSKLDSMIFHTHLLVHRLRKKMSKHGILPKKPHSFEYIKVFVVCTVSGLLLTNFKDEYPDLQV